MEDDDSTDDSDEEDEEITITQDGAKLIQFSPDGKWLLVITPGSKVVLVPIVFNESAGERRTKVSVSLSPEVFLLDRIPRAFPSERFQQSQKGQQENGPNINNKKNKILDYGNLGHYPHIISRVAFSSDSSILVATDLSGHIESYILQGTEWKLNPAGSLLPKLEHPVAAMEFRPASSKQFSEGIVSRLPQIAAPEDSEDESQPLEVRDNQEDRLMILTSHNQSVFEFHVLKGRLTDWSRRNPPSRFITDFRNVKDIGCGIVWEIEETDNAHNGETIFAKERVWFWGPNWIWMFDLQQDFPESDNNISNSTTLNIRDHNIKRKRGTDAGKLKNSTTANSHKRADTDGDVAMLDDITPSSDDDDLNDGEDDDSAGTRWGKFSRTPGKSADADSAAPVDPKLLDRFGRVKGSENSGKPYWCQYKYRPIMALLPIGAWVPRSHSTPEDIGDEGISEKIKELLVVERPAWDIELPPRFFGKRERNDELGKGIWS